MFSFQETRGRISEIRRDKSELPESTSDPGE